MDTLRAPYCSMSVCLCVCERMYAFVWGHGSTPNITHTKAFQAPNWLVLWGLVCCVSYLSAHQLLLFKVLMKAGMQSVMQ